MRNLSRGLILLIAVLLPLFASAQETRTYFVTDVVGSPVLATDENGNVRWEEGYLPYGERQYDSPNADSNERWFSNAPQNSDSGLVDFVNRMYDPVVGRFYGIDPVGASAEDPFLFNRYVYANNNPFSYIDGDGNSPISVLAKLVAKKGLKEGVVKMGQRQFRRLGRYMTKTEKKQFLADVADIVSSLDSSPLEIAFEFIPVLGDIYGGAKFSKEVTQVYHRLQNLENQWVERMLRRMSKDEQEKFKVAMRRAGVRDAKQDQGIVRSGSGLEMHHNDTVLDVPHRASDPRHIEALSPEEHLRRHHPE